MLTSLRQPAPMSLASRSLRSFAARMGIAGAILLLPVSQALLAIGRQYQVRQLAPHAFVWIPDDVMDQNGDPHFSRAGNVGFVITDQGVVVINTANNPSHAREVLYEIRQRTDIPVRLVIDAGPQGDQVLGNEVFAEQQATIVATSATETLMRSYQQDLAHRMSYDPELPLQMRGIHVTLPGQVFQGQKSFDIGGQEIRVISMSCALAGKAGGDAVVYLPKAKVLFLGDLYVNGYVPGIDARDVHRWIDVLGHLEKWDATVYVPNHGDPGAEKDLANFQGFLEWLEARVRAGVQEGKSLSEVEDDLLRSQPLNLLAPDLAPRAIAAVYRQLSRARAASARFASPATNRDRKHGLRPGNSGFLGNHL